MIALPVAAGAEGAETASATAEDASSNAHLAYVAEVVSRVKQTASRNRGYRRTYEPEVLGHFFSRFEPLAS